MTLNVDPAALVASAAHAANQGEDLAVGHMTTDGWIASAEVGWQGASAVAMGEKLAAWASTSTVLLQRISDHVQGLQSCAVGFAEQDQQSRAALETLTGGGSAAAR